MITPEQQERLKDHIRVFSYRKRAIYENLTQTGITVDEMAQRTGLKRGTVRAYLSRLATEGWACHLRKGIYGRSIDWIDTGAAACAKEMA
jgi:DNA-binding GntR family transcriptional regulator